MNDTPLSHIPYLSSHQQATMPSLARTRALALGLARVSGDPVAILANNDLYWLATPADRAVFWQREIDRGDVTIVETIPGNRTLAPAEVTR